MPKMFWLIVITAAVLNDILMTTCKEHIYMTVNTSMPFLYVFDDYNECLYSNKFNFSQVYCMTYVEVVPDNTSFLWQQIETFSNSYQFHYRHDHLFRGMCLKNYTNLTETTINNSYYNLAESKIKYNFKRIFNNSNEEIIKLYYQHEIVDRLNGEFHNEYNLSFQMLTLYCDSEDVTETKGFGFKLTILVCAIIVLLNIVSTLYEGWLTSQQALETNSNECNKNNQISQVSRFLISFSLKRNFCRLLRPNKSNIGIDLGFLDGFRSILAFLIVYEHSYNIQFVHLKNPEFFENLYHQYLMKFMLHGLVLVELFFVLSGLMLIVKLENGEYITKDTNLCRCFQVYGKLLLSRYLRIIPSLAFLILINANILLYLQRGTFWRFMMESYRFYCSKYWWKNILLINNFNISNTCLSHTWYLAADFQLYAFFLMVLIFVKKYPKIKVCAFLIIAILSAIIPVLINYIFKLNSIAFMKTESFRYFYLTDVETGAQLYLPSYTNLHGFLIGIICGELYMKLIRKYPNAKNSIGKVLKYFPYIGWPCIMGIFAIGTLVLEQQPSVWSALYGILHRHVTLIILTVSTILLMMCKVGTISKMLSSLPFRLLARISYQLYLWHFNVILITANFFHQPINVTYYLMFMILAVTYIISNIVALIFAIAIEYPISEILNLINLK